MPMASASGAMLSLTWLASSRVGHEHEGPGTAGLAGRLLGGRREARDHRQAEGDRLAAARAAAAEDVTAGERVGQRCDLDRERLGDAAFGEHRDECGGYSEGFERRAGVAGGPCVAQGCSRTCRAQMVFLIVRAGRLRSPDVLDGSDALEARLRTTSVSRRDTRPSHHARWIHGTTHSAAIGRRFAEISGGQPGVGDRLHVPEVGAAAAAQHGQVRQRFAQPDVPRAEVGRIAVIELLRLVQLGMAERRRVGPQPADALDRRSSASVPAKCVGCAQLIRK